MNARRRLSASEGGPIGVRALVLLAVVLAAVAAGAVAIGTTGGGGDDPVTSATRAGPEEFAARIGDPAAFLVNVHTPYEGEIAGTDAFIVFDEIAGDPQLPADKDTEVLLYCRSGRMSAIAADTLVEAGYTNVIDLEGGMVAWEAAGMTVTGTGG